MPAATAPRIWALVPFKGPDGAKGRLGEYLSERERRDLTLAMLRDVLDALTQASLAGVLIVSRSPTAAALARDFDVEVFADTANDLTGAVTEASTFVADRAQGTMIVHGDLPLLTGHDVNDALRGHTDVTLLPDRHDIGTNCIIATPPNAMTYQFDGRSFRPHKALARAAGLEPRVVRLPGFALDIDTIDGLREFAATGSDTRSGRYLVETGVASRLAATHN